MIDREETSAALPLVQEQLSIEKRTVETGKVRIRTVVEEKLARVAEDLERDDVTIERVPVNREVTEVPQIREADGVLIVPVLEEVVFVEKRLVLKEELHVRRNRKRERFEQAVQLKQMHAEVQRVAPARADAPAVAEPGNARSARTPRLRRSKPLRPDPE